MPAQAPENVVPASDALDRETGSTVSIIQDKSLTYPDAADFFSPDQAYPEYPHGHLSQKPNAVYGAVRRCLAEAGLDLENFGKPGWNPLGGLISPGQKVFILCNFVQHNIERDIEAGFAKCTHGSVVRAVVDYVLIALKGKGSVSFGNAPVQSCKWEQVIEETGAARVRDFYAGPGRSDVRVELVDLRQQILHRSALGKVETRFQGEEADLCTPVDLGADSLLDEFYQSSEDPKLRVLDYDYRRTQGCHAKGRHVYLVSKRVLESDVIISVPKLKTHEKVGVTCGIKGCVGTVAQKDCLAHHRVGAPRAGGDEYPNALSFLKPISSLHDAVYTRPPSKVRNILHFLNYYSRMVVRRFTRSLSGSWHGNDTCWRMAVDLARIVEYADKKGQLHSEKQRTHVMLTDGVVAGEGDGPLSPKPVNHGYLSFSTNVAVGDYFNCRAMGFDPEKLPLIRNSFKAAPYRLSKSGLANCNVRINGDAANGEAVQRKFSRKFSPPREWRGFV